MFSRTIDSHLSLRLMSPLDAEEAYEIIDRNRDRLRRFLPFIDDVHSPEDERKGLEKLVLTWPLKPFGTWIVLDGLKIGSVGLHAIDMAARMAEIGYWVDAAYEGKGYVTQAVREMERLAFLDLGVHRVQITNDVANRRSRAIPEKLGYTLEGILRSHLVAGGGRIVDQSMYSILRDEWETREGLSGATA